MSKPVILITGMKKYDPSRKQTICFLDETYLDAVKAGGGIPIVSYNFEEAEELASIADGLILTGGKSVHPRYFGKTFDQLCGNDPQVYDFLVSGCNAQRDEAEFAFYRAFKAACKPIMGICRGFQLLNVAMGGVNMLDFPRMHPTEHNYGVFHKVITEENSILADLFGKEFTVNSYHRDCAENPGPEARITAKSDDGIIEAIEHRTLPIYGFQFHPERMRGERDKPVSSPDSTPLFKFFIEQCGKAK